MPFSFGGSTWKWIVGLIIAFIIGYAAYMLIFKGATITPPIQTPTTTLTPTSPATVSPPTVTTTNLNLE